MDLQGSCAILVQMKFIKVVLEDHYLNRSEDLRQNDDFCDVFDDIFAKLKYFLIKYKE